MSGVSLIQKLKPPKTVAKTSLIHLYAFLTGLLYISLHEKTVK